jgi:hypothetical protein
VQVAEEAVRGLRPVIGKRQRVNISSEGQLTALLYLMLFRSSMQFWRTQTWTVQWVEVVGARRGAQQYAVGEVEVICDVLLLRQLQIFDIWSLSRS